MPLPRRARGRYLIPSATLLLLAACGSGGGGGGDEGDNGSSPGDPQLSRVTLEEVQERVVAWFPIAIRDAPEARNIRKSIVEDGWEPFVRDGVQTALVHFNLRRVMIHSPFGRNTTEPEEFPFQFDQYLEAEDAGLTRVTDTFVDAWRNYITGPNVGLNVEVIAYIGSPRLDPDSQQVIEEQGYQTFEDGFASQAVAPMLAADMAIGYDAAAGTQRDSATYRFAETLRGRGEKVYIEANPQIDHTWWFDYPVIVIDKTWRQRMADGGFAGRDELTGEIIRIVHLEDGWVENHEPEEWPEAMCRVIAEGGSLTVQDVLLRQPTRRLEDLRDCANAIVEGS